MAVTVKQVMELEAFAESVVLIAGHGGIKNVITYITVSETPDFYEWVSGGEFVLTTLYAYKDQQQEQVIRNFTELAKRGVAAFGVKVQRFVDSIPWDMIHIANQYHVPLFAVGRETKFRRIIQLVTAELNNYQTNILLEVESHYKELAKVALVSGDFTDYIRGFGRRTDSSVYCFRSDLKLLGSYQKTAASQSIQSAREALIQYLQQDESLDTGRNGDSYIFPCVTRGQALGYLVVIHSAGIREKHMVMASQLTTFLTMKLADQLETEQKMLTSLLDELLYKRNLKEEELRERLALYGLKHQQAYRVVIVKEKAEGGTPQSDHLRACCLRIKALFSEALLIVKTNEVVLIAANEQSDEAGPPRWLKNVTGLLGESPPVLVGIGPAVNNASEIQSSYQIARSTIKAGNALRYGSVLYYGHFLARILLLSSLGTPEQEYLIAKIISPLLQQDLRHNTQILPTIEAAMFADDIEQAAAALFVHANTVRYRLNKIKSLTGYDFFTAQGRYTIITAYLVYCYNK